MATGYEVLNYLTVRESRKGIWVQKRKGKTSSKIAEEIKGKCWSDVFIQTFSIFQILKEALKVLR